MSNPSQHTPGQAVPFVRQRLGLGESPVVHRNYLYWVDIYAGKLYRRSLNPQISQVSSWDVGEVVGCVAIHETPNTVIIAQRNTITAFNLITGAKKPIAAADYDTTQLRFNDGRCDAAGRLWVGTYDAQEQPHGGIYCVDLDGTLSLRIPSIAIANALAWSPDNSYMYYGDTAAQLIYRRLYDTRTGGLGLQEVFLDLRGTDEYPDGAAVDTDGCYWVAMYGSGKVVQFSSDGQRLRSVSLPVNAPTMPAFGGSNLATLYITTAGKDDSKNSLAGSIFMYNTDTHGLPEPTCSVTI